ncbi:MAG: hypothetical protein AOA65_1451 [Candidatus Bathyarchaeota archaeon BA1]|nr:MAG: hypothetical protein AOA65_1451 [Candidatus Bathyarchaeota archaeon BA1]
MIEQASVKPLEEMGIPKLTAEQIEELCRIADRAAREYILSKVPSHRIADLNVTVETEGVKPITVNVDVEITLSPLMKSYDVEKMAKEAIKEAFLSIETYLRGLAGHRLGTCLCPTNSARSIFDVGKTKS